MSPTFTKSKAILAFLAEHKGARLIQCERVMLNAADTWWVQLPTHERLKCDGRAAQAAWRHLNPEKATRLRRPAAIAM